MERQTINLREHANGHCQGCDANARKANMVNGLCARTFSMMDGLPVRCVGKWAYSKIYHLVSYFGIFAQGMKFKWNGLNYVELCSGPGRCAIHRENREIDGTALSIITHPVFSFIKSAIFIDANEVVVETLNKRIYSLCKSSKAKAVIGNYNDTAGIKTILEQLHPNYLNLAFIDPTECDIPFETIVTIIDQLQNTDLIINVALGTDVTRNIAAAVNDPSFSRAKSKYEKFLGSPGFCDRAEIAELAKVGASDHLRRKFIEEYKNKLAGFGYKYTDSRQVEHFYYLLYASRHNKGLEFWKKACSIEPDSQRLLL